MLRASGCLNHALDSLNDRDGEKPGCEVTGRDPVPITCHVLPFDLHRAKWSEDGGAFQLLVSVEDDGRDPLHKTTRARHTGESRSGSLMNEEWIRSSGLGWTEGWSGLN